MERKFNPYQRVVVKDFMMNGVRGDTFGEVKRYVRNADTGEWRVEVVINSCYCLLTEDKLEDYNQYWERKKGEQ